MLTKLLLPLAAVALVASAACAATAPPSSDAARISCENQAKGRHGNTTADCEELAAAWRYAETPRAPAASPVAAADKTTCDNQYKGRHGEGPLECAYVPAPLPPRYATPPDPEAMKGHRNTIGQ